MSGDRPNQFTFDFLEGKESSTTPFVTTRALRRHRSCDSVLKKLFYVRRYFPEFTNVTIRVGLTRAASGMAVPGGRELWFNPNRLTYHTIAHEFVHLLQGKNGVPKGERSCDVFSLARHWTLNDRPPCYIRVPREFHDLGGTITPEHAVVIYSVACRALQWRGAGTRNYIVYFEKALENLQHTLPGGFPVAELV